MVRHDTPCCVVLFSRTASISLSTTDVSVMVDTSPRSVVSPHAIFRSRRRMIFPDRVFGRTGTCKTWSGRANGPTLPDPLATARFMWLVSIGRTHPEKLSTPTCHRRFNTRRRTRRRRASSVMASASSSTTVVLAV